MNNSKGKLGFAGKLASLFLKNKQLGFLSIAILLFWGILSFVLMPKQYNPEIVAPAFRIVTDFPGASSDEVYELITRPMENKLRELPKVDKIMSQSFDGGSSVVTVQFLIGENLEDAKISLIQKMESNMEFKPLGAHNPQIIEINPDDVPILTIAFSSSDYSPESLRKIALEVGEKIKHVDGISKLEVKGGEKRQLSVRLDEEKLNAFNLSVDQVFVALEKNNTRMFAGNIEGETVNYRVVIDGNVRTKQDLKELVIVGGSEQEILLADVATIAYDTGDKKAFAKLTTKDSSQNAVFLGIAKLKGSNATTVANEILAKLPEVSKLVVPTEVNWEVVRNDGRVAAESIGGLSKNLLTAIAIVSLVLLLFLGWKSAVVVAIAIPLTLAAVFGIGNLFGQTINRITLFALILSLGLLVDNATVVVENVFRLFKERGESGNNEGLVVKAVDEVGAGLIMSTVTTILAFIPMAFISGMMGPYMGPIPFFIPVALLVSLVVAFTVNPFLLNFFLQRGKEKSARTKGVFLKITDKVKKFYGQVLRAILFNERLRRRILTAVFLLLVVVMSFPLFQIVKFRMLPKADREQFFIYLDLPSFANIAATSKLVESVEKVVVANGAVRNVQSFVGQAQVVDFNGLFKGSESRVGENQATLKVNLIHPDERKETSAEIALDLRKELNTELSAFPDAELKIIEDPPGPPVLSTFLLKVQGDNDLMLQKIAKQLENQAQKIEEVVDIDTSVVERNREYALRVDKNKATRLGLSSSEIARTLRAVLEDVNVGIFHQRSGEEFAKREQEFIVLAFEHKDLNERTDLAKISVSNSKGEKVALSEVVSWEKLETLPVISSDERRKTIYVSAEMGERSVTYGMIDMFSFLLNYKLPTGTGELERFSLWDFDFKDSATGDVYRIVLDGEWKLTLEVFRDLGIAMAVAVFMIYFVLVAQFGSLKIPLLIMGTIPLAMIGVMPGFALLGWSKGLFFNATSMIGVIALAGIVVNNAIIFLEYFKELRAGGVEHKEALISAGKTRLLPILLTSMTTVLGSLTIIGDPVWAGLSWSIIWGLSLSAFLTLFIFPILLVEFASPKN